MSGVSQFYIAPTYNPLFSPPPFLPSLFIPRLSSQGYFSLCSSSFLPSLSLSFSKRKIHIFHGRRCNTSPGRPRPTNFSLVPISFASECSFLNRFRQPFTIYTRGGDTKRASLTRLVAERCTASTRSRVPHDGEGMCVA